MVSQQKIDQGIELISILTEDKLVPMVVRDILYKMITKDYNTIDAILAEAVKQGLLIRDEDAYYRTEVQLLEFEKPKKRIVEEKGKCLVCGRSLTKCCYIEFSSRVYGPFGTECVQKVLLDY